MLVNLIDKPLLRRRMSRALKGGRGDATFLLEAASADLLERLAAVERRFSSALVFGGGPVRLAERVVESGKAESAMAMEPVVEALGGAGGIVADEEALPLAAGSIDLFLTPLLLQWTNDLPGALVQIVQALRPDGLFLSTLLGGETLSELRQALMAAETEVRGGTSPRVLPFADVRDLGALLQRAGFALPVVDRDVLTVRYDTVFALFADLKAMGGTNILTERDRRPAGRGFFVRAAEIYAERFADPDGRIRATFEFISLSGWAPHESQQQPARRGSGHVSLRDVMRPGER